MEQTKKISPQTIVSGESKKKNCQCKQTVRITDDGKAIIKAHNGLIDAEGNSSVYINGEFSIDADSVRKLSAALQGKNFYVVNAGFCGPTHIDVFTSDKAIAATIENLKKEIEAQITENRALNDNLKKAELKNTKLLNEVRYYNSNRRPWERKINISE
jgi:hypothetical protein